MIAGGAPSRWLAVVTAAPPLVKKPKHLARLPACADLVELRLDLLLPGSKKSLEAWVEASPRPVLATIRSRAEGGEFDGTPAEAAALLASAADAGAAWIDAEANVAQLLPTLPGSTRLVLSSHGWDLADAESDAPDRPLRKVAVPVDSADALVRARDLHGPRAFTVPYGPLGMMRAAFVSASPTFVFGAADEASSVVGGQPPLRRLLDELRLGEVSPEAALFGLVGAPPAWSPSPAMHNAVFRAEGRDALYVPLPDVMLDHALTLPLEGISVTTPAKRDAYEAASALDEAARRTGAVNTFVRDGGTWHGSNTDVDGIRRCLPEHSDDATAFVYGAGGYARAAVVALRDAGFTVRMGARQPERGKTTAWEMGVPYVGDRYERSETDAVFVNATPAGAHGEPLSFVTPDDLAGLVVLDAPYSSSDTETTLVELASEAEAVHDGRDLLVAQAIAQARVFGSELQVDHLETVLRLAARPIGNLWLLGLRGAGKSTVGRAVARWAGRPFVDLDAEVERIDGRTIRAIVESDGWDAFRALESLALERVADRRGLVVATGGGVVEDDRNLDALAASGTRIWLDVDPAEAALRTAHDDTRPRLPGAKDAFDESAQAYERRQARYATVATHTVDVDADEESVVADTLRVWVAALGM